MFVYRAEILDALARHGLKPAATTSPERLRDAVRDLYKYEIKVIRSALLAGRIAKKDYAGQIVRLRGRYWLLSLPTELWTLREVQNSSASGS